MRGIGLLVVEQTADVRVAVDADRFMQVMADLLANAAKIFPSQSKAEIFTIVHGNWVRISVQRLR